MVKNHAKNFAISGPFSDLQEFFKNRELTFETSDSDFRDLLDELFHIDQKIIFVKNQNAGLISKSHLLSVDYNNDNITNFEISVGDSRCGCWAGV